MSNMPTQKEIAARLSQQLEAVQSNMKKRNGFYWKIETRARKADYSDSLSFEISDPLWTLGRQWQFGRFQANNCGSAVQTKINVRKDYICCTINKKGERNPLFRWGYNMPTENEKMPPMEYEVEKRPREIDFHARVESALHFLQMYFIPKDRTALLKALIDAFPLDPIITEEAEALEKVKIRANTKLDKLYRFYKDRCFDGYKLYLADRIPTWTNNRRHHNYFLEYQEWFRKKYLPTDETDQYWNDKKLGYELGLFSEGSQFIAEDYHTGRLSWYSFDYDERCDREFYGPIENKTLTAIPTAATFPAAPNRRLWEFENRRVQFNDWRNDDTSALASSVILQYTLMYSNDWMIVPLETEAGTLLNVQSIEVTDSFGRTFTIRDSYENVDIRNMKPAWEKEYTFINRWAMFGNSELYSYRQGRFNSYHGLLCPPTLQRVEQGDPVEVVQFLRDEMANMVWGVEERVSDGCGGSLDSRSRSDKVFSIVDEERRVDDSDVIRPKDADYSFLIENRVPLHWIPFIPEKVPPRNTWMDGQFMNMDQIQGATSFTVIDQTEKNEVAGRDIVFRRGRMPIWYDGDYRPVLPSSQLLAVKKDAYGKTKPRYIYEEEIQGYGTRVGLYPQRTRWFNGTSYTWYGYEKKISGTQANSGLMFDALLDVEKKEE